MAGTATISWLTSSSGNGYSFFKTITIDKTKVPNTNQTNFPVLISGTYTYLKTTGNGGSVQNANGYDIIFTSDSAGLTLLKWETERWIASTGEVIFWVKIPTLSTSVNTVIYMWYGNSSISTDQSDRANTWDSNYLAVYHLKDGSTLDLTNAVTGSAATNNSATATTGQIDGAAALSGSSQYINLGNNFGPIGDFTIEAWVNPTDYANFNGIVSKTSSFTAKPYDYYLVQSTGIPRLFIGDGSGSGNIDGTSAPSTGVWSHIAAVKTGLNTISHYLNGSINGSGNAPGSPNPLANGTDVAYIGTRGDLFTMFKGSIDEVRISQSARSADWLATQYNNQSSPSTFYSIA